MAVEEVYRFDNRPVERDGRYVWDVDYLQSEIFEGLVRADERGTVESVGVDAWGVDFGLLADGDLVQAPYSYRDPKVGSTVEAITDTVPRRELFDRTGINHWNIANTLWQYHYLVNHEPEVIERADTLLMMPQIISTLLGGEPRTELTAASTSQMLDPDTGKWAEELLAELDLPTGLLPSIDPPGTTVGTLSQRFDSAVTGTPNLVFPASHDTASAVAGLPLTEGNRAFLIAGTWFLVGVEVKEPVLTDAAFEAGASNELGADDTVRLLSNVNGFFLLEECRETWRSRGAPVDYDTLLAGATESDAFGPLVNPDDPGFGIEGEMPAQIRSYCRATGQDVPASNGEIVRCILESLAAKAAIVLDDLLDVAGEDAAELHLGGGGVRNDVFCRYVAQALDRPVHAGPAEATAVGNVLTQAEAEGTIEDVEHGRRIVSRELSPTVYEPTRDSRWEDAKAKMRNLMDTEVSFG